jgi:hypothetical protein
MRDEEGKVLTAGDVFYNNGNRPSNFCRLPSMCSLRIGTSANLRLPAVDTLKRYSKALEYEYRVKTVALGTLKRYSILSLTPNLLLSLSLNTSWQARSSVTVTVTVTVTA